MHGSDSRAGHASAADEMSYSDPTMADDTPVTRARLLGKSGRFAIPIPDALMAVILALAAAIEFLPPHSVPMLIHQSRDELFFSLIVEGGFLLMTGTLVDIATRLRKRPPVWVIALIVAGVVLFSGEARMVLQMAWQRGSIVFIPLLLSLAERATMLWHMPGQPRVRKIAARALVGNRITTGLALFGLLTAIMLLGVAFPQYAIEGGWLPLAAGAIYFAIAAYDDWRVRGKRFAERPTVLFRFDPIHIDYLEPV